MTRRHPSAQKTCTSTLVCKSVESWSDLKVSEYNDVISELLEVNYSKGNMSAVDN